MHMNIQRGFPHTKYTNRLTLQSHPESTLGELKPKEFSLDLEGPNDCRMDSLFFGFIWQWFQWFFCSTNLISTYLYCNRLSSASTVLFYEPKRYKLWHKHKDYQPESIYLFRFFIECICVCVCAVRLLDRNLWTCSTCTQYLFILSTNFKHFSWLCFLR